MNKFDLTARVVGISKAENKGKTITNCYLREREGKEEITYKAPFWEAAAEYVLKNVEKNDEIQLTCYVSRWGENTIGRFIELKNCKLKNIIQRKRIAVEDMLSLSGKE